MSNFSDGVEMQNFYLRMKNELEEAGINAASFELRQILSTYTGDEFYDIRLENEFPEEVYIAAEEAVKRRIAGEPLQYILGEWDFMGITFEVGEGVLIPRPETELLTEKALDYLVTLENPRALDLCCGSGCIGVSIKKLLPKVNVTCADLYDKPLFYTAKNADKNEVEISIIRADATKPTELRGLDAIISNPPYIVRRELPELQTEVLREPREALDGGEDGLDFYRAIVENYTPALKPCGRFFFEVGIYEAESVAEILRGAGFENIGIIQDYAGIGRVVTGSKPQA